MNEKEFVVVVLMTIIFFCCSSCSGFLFCSNSSAYDHPWEKDYVVVRKLGGGFFGDTWLLKNEIDNSEYVLKKIKSQLSTSSGVHFHLSGIREVYFGTKLHTAMSDLSSPGKDHVGRFVKHYDDGNSMQLVSIFEGIQLKSLLYKFNIDGDILTPSDWWVWMRTTTRGNLVMKNLIHQLLLGVKFCKDNNIVHRDIKPSNIVVCFETTNRSCNAVNPSFTSDIHLRLIDFGSAVDDHSKKFMYGKSGPTSVEQYDSSMPPEAIIDTLWTKYSLSTKYDSWTVGQTILEFIFGTPKVFNLTNSEAIEMVKEINYSNNNFFLRTASMAEQCIGLSDMVKVERMNELTTCTDNGYADYIRNRDPLRIGFPDVELFKLVRLLLKADPNLRIGVDEALHHPYFAVSTHDGISHYYIALSLGSITISLFGCYMLKVYRDLPKEENKKKVD